VKLELTRRGDYAVRAMLALAAQGGDSPMSARRIAEQMAIPARFVPHVLADLVAAGLVTARTGRTGGYRLARPAAEISLLDVITAVEGDARRTACVLRGIPCGSDGYCAVHPVFMAAQDAMLETLAGATLADVPLDPST
jgi:Rrf2 family iron-sulfur cluster assembly transcriptional regulator